MDKRIIPYLEGTLSDEERIRFLREAVGDGSTLGEELIACHQVDTLWELTAPLTQQEERNTQRSYDRFIRTRRRRAFRRIASQIAGAAALFVAALFVSRFLVTHPSAAVPDPPMLTTSTPAGHRALQTLPDGSQVWLNAGSTLTYPASFGDERRVSIVGEAFFDVASDESKPFIVSTGKLDIKALGTQFDVFNYNDSELAVSLIDGSIALYNPDKEQSVIILKPGEQLAESGDGYIRKSFVSDAILWVDGYYSFRNQTMADILSKLELYYDVHFVATDPNLLNLTYTGKFRQTDGVKEIIRLLSNVHPFHFREDSNQKTIYIY